MRGITQEKALRSYQQLLSLPPGQSRSRAGLPALDYLFFDHRMRTKTKSGLSFIEALERPDILEHLQRLVVRYKIKGKEAIHHAFRLWYGSISQFRPAIAKWVIHRYAPVKGVLDFSAGWGGRALASMSLGVPYIGVDTNIHLEEPYRRLQEYNSSSPITMIWRPAEEVSFDFPYDMVFTSPPYYTLERYENMPTYRTKRIWYDTFLIPVIQKAWKGLSIGGVMALNMPREYYEVVQEYLPPLLEELAMPLSHRGVGRKGKAQETIYVWKKMCIE